MLQRIVDESDRVCKRRKLNVNVAKSKVMVLKRAREQTTDFVKPNRVEEESTTVYNYDQGGRREDGEVI